MGLENPTYIEDLNASWPLASDPVSEGDDHTRNVKATLQASFPGTSGPWNAPGQNFSCGSIGTTANILAGGAVTSGGQLRTQSTFLCDGQATFVLDIGCRDVNARDLYASGGIDIEGDASIQGEIRENAQVAIAAARINNNAFDGPNFGIATIDQISAGTYELELVETVTNWINLNIHVSGSGGFAFFGCNVGTPTVNPDNGQWFRVVTGQASDSQILELPFNVTVWDRGRN